MATNVRTVDMDGGDLGRALSTNRPDRLVVVKAIELAVAEMLATSVDGHESHGKSESFVYPIEVGKGFAYDNNELEEWLASDEVVEALPYPFVLYSDPGSGKRVFNVYGASGGMAACVLFYVVAPICSLIERRNHALRAV